MGITLIFVSQMEVTDSVYRSDLLDCPGGEGVPGNNSINRPYPKPTQVEW